MTAHDEQRFYREGRKVFDREKSTHGHDPRTGAYLYCEARSNHAAEVIQHALNSWHGMGPTRTLPKWIKRKIAKKKILRNPTVTALDAQEGE